MKSRMFLMRDKSHTKRETHGERERITTERRTVVQKVVKKRNRK